MDKTMRKLLLSKISFIAVGTAAHAGDAPAAPAAAVTSFLDGEPGSITVAGITVYGTVDVGAVYESHGTRQGNGLLYLGPEYLIQKNSNKSQAVNASNGLSQSTVGIKGKQAIKDLTGFDALPGWSLLFDLQVGFNPASCEPANAVGSLTKQNGVALQNQISGADGSRAGQVFNGEAYVGAKHDVLGQFTFGRQNTLAQEDFAAYDPQKHS